MKKAGNPVSKKTGRPPKPMPEPIPDTPEKIMRALVNTPPKKHGEWDYLDPASTPEMEVES